MESKKIARKFLVLNLLISLVMICLTTLRKGAGEGLLACFVSAWLSSGAFFYLKDWTIPLMGPFAFDQGQRQVARCLAVCVMTLMLWLLVAYEVWLFIETGSWETFVSIVKFGL